MERHLKLTLTGTTQEDCGITMNAEGLTTQQAIGVLTIAQENLLNECTPELQSSWYKMQINQAKQKLKSIQHGKQKSL